MIRNSWPIFALTLALMTGCATRDTELLGDPEPAQQETAQSEPAPPAESEAVEDEYRAEPEPVDETLPIEGTFDVDPRPFFDDLRFYGGWYDLPPYGQVWRPVVTPDWSPMVYGRWVWTVTYGWIWFSYDPFGNDVYNYGYWVDDFALGWVWIPSFNWAPVQCEWITWDDTVCWAPLPPPNVYYPDPWQGGHVGPWVSVPIAKFKDVAVAQYRQAPKYKNGVSDKTLRRAAPDFNVVERGYGRPIKAVNVRLDQSMVGNREFTRVVLPPDIQNGVDERRAGAPQPAGREGRSAGGFVDSNNSDPTPQPKVKGSSGTRDRPRASPVNSTPPRRIRKTTQGRRQEGVRNDLAS
jgi:hypothetical protein